MKIIIAGAGAVGTHLAKLLSDEKQDIILMDENEEKLSKLDSNFDLMTVNASPTSISGLKNAGVAGADLFIGVMPEESRNMTACMLATNMGTKKTVARILGPIGVQAEKAITHAEQETGKSIAHYDLRFLKPLDESMLHEIGKRFKQVVTVEDGVLKGGMGSAILEFMADNEYNRS